MTYTTLAGPTLDELAAANRATEQRYQDTLFKVLNHQLPPSALDMFVQPADPVVLPDIVVPNPKKVPWPLLIAGAVLLLVVMQEGRR